MTWNGSDSKTWTRSIIGFDFRRQIFFLHNDNSQVSYVYYKVLYLHGAEKNKRSENVTILKLKTSIHDMF